MKLFISLALLLLGTTNLFAQNHTENHNTTKLIRHHNNFVGVFVGHTVIAQSGFQMPTVGIEYIREIAPNIGIGFVTEYEFGSHIVQKNEEGHIISEVEREGAFLILPSAFFKVHKGLCLTVGYGIEIEKHENLVLAKVGLEYKFQMNNPNWLILPAVSWDHTNLFDGIVYGVTFGYGF